MPFDMAAAILDEAGRRKLADLVLLHIMGEPTLHPNLIEIVEHAHTRGLRVCLTTNGARMTPDMLALLMKTGVRKIIISLQTPDFKSFYLRRARDISFDEYAERIVALARKFVEEAKGSDTQLVISFLTTPLRRLIIPIMEEFSIADTAAVLRREMAAWAEKILIGLEGERRLSDVLMRINGAGVFRENTIHLTDMLSFHTRLLGDWAGHFKKDLIPARFGCCQGLQENFGVLWNGDFTYCCTDYDGKTSTGNFRNLSLTEYLASAPVQKAVKGFRSFRLVHPHCRLCIGDSSWLNVLGKGIGSIVYFKWLERRRTRRR